MEVEVEAEVERRDDGAPGVGGLERGWRDRRDCRAGDYRGAVETEQRGFEATPTNWATSAGDYRHCTLYELGASGVAGSSPPSHPHP